MSTYVHMLHLRFLLGSSIVGPLISAGFGCECAVLFFFFFTHVLLPSLILKNYGFVKKKKQTKKKREEFCTFAFEVG